MAALEAAIHLSVCADVGMDGRVKPGHDIWGQGAFAAAAILSTAA